ncbi:hypothetical protein M9H77_25298 [Catharanthus roseus]|uniref:Uncharacterized protein n=1 Tax=Catharanthus roseus TaxID=4058 RepID=A0ACC0A7Y7_CATRO|nr:hypothetical protein M9H77_25298 [Catharanthus roseus]
MENSREDCVLSCDTIDLESCVTLKSAGVDEDDLMLLESVTEEVPYAFQFYNDYTFKLGFSIRKGRKRYRAGSGIIYMRQVNCHKEGKTSVKGSLESVILKLISLCPVNHRHLMRSQRAVTKNHVGYFQELKDGRVYITASLRVLKKQIEGSPFIGFTSRDAYNSLQLVKSNNLDEATGIWKISVATKDKYILERWTKNIALSWGNSGVGDTEKVNNKGNVVSRVWRMEMLRKFSYLIFASELNVNARECVEEGFKMMRHRIVVEVGPYRVDDLGNKGSSIIKDPTGSRAKRERNCNQVKGKRKNALMRASRNKMVIQLSMNNEALEKVVNFCIFQYLPNFITQSASYIICNTSHSKKSAYFITMSHVLLSLVCFHVPHTKDSTIYVVFTVLPWNHADLYLVLHHINIILAINTTHIASVKLTVESICKVCDAHFIIQWFT